MQDEIPGNLTIQDETNFGSIVKTFLKNCWPLNIWPTHIWLVHLFCIQLKNNMTLDNSFGPQVPNILCNSYKQTVSSDLLLAGAASCKYFLYVKFIVWNSFHSCLEKAKPWTHFSSQNVWILFLCCFFVVPFWYLFCFVLVTLFIQRKVFSDSYWMSRSVLICCVDFSPVKCWTHLQTVM